MFNEIVRLSTSTLGMKPEIAPIRVYYYALRLYLSVLSTATSPDIATF